MGDVVAGLEDSAHRQQKIGSGLNPFPEATQHGVAILIEAGNVEYVQEHAGVHEDDWRHDVDDDRAGAAGACRSPDLLSELIQPRVGALLPLFWALMSLHETFDDPARHEVAD